MLFEFNFIVCFYCKLTKSIYIYVSVPHWSTQGNVPLLHFCIGSTLMLFVYFPDVLELTLLLLCRSIFLAPRETRMKNWFGNLTCKSEAYFFSIQANFFISMFDKWCKKIIMINLGCLSLKCLRRMDMWWLFRWLFFNSKVCEISFIFCFCTVALFSFSSFWRGLERQEEHRK